MYDGSERLFGKALTLDIGATYEPAAQQVARRIGKDDPKGERSSNEGTEF